MSRRGSGRLGDTAWWLLPLLAGVVMLLPRWPGLIDLPGHMARYHIELTLARSVHLQRYYAFDWLLIPNLGVDLLIYPLTRALGLEVATRIVVASIPMLAMFGILALGRVVHGRITATTIAALPCALAYPLVFGFVNFCLGAALAFCAGAVWISLAHGGRFGRQLLFGSIVSPLLLLVHLTAWGLFGLIAFGSMVGLGQTAGWRHAMRKALLTSSPLLWPAAVLLAIHVPTPGGTGGWLDVAKIVGWTIGVVRERYAWLDVPSALLMFAVAALPLFRRRFCYSTPLLIPAILTWIAVLALPTMIIGSAFANVRLIPAALALTMIAVRPPSQERESHWPRAAALIFVLIRLAATGSALLAYDAKATRQLAALQAIGPGSRVLSFTMQECARRWDPPRSQNLQLLATVRRDALVNGHFSEAGAQLLTVRYPAAPSLMHLGTQHVMDRPCSRSSFPSLANALRSAPLAAFDYLWLIDVPPPQRPHNRNLRPLWQAEDSVIYAIRPR